ncbi:Integrator complex subunit 7 [Halotydeus destructor]|nr:Integrator complex subunit 7 [Halotydeus destructor]
MSSFIVTGSNYAEESSLDANALLNELDKGLRSPRAGEQCEAIVRFPWLVERYPFPILINAASLKLADVFRNGSNFSRLLVLKTLQHCEKHLDKILNVDEFVRRLFGVTHSNDPVARSITLRALGAIADIVSERKSMHHTLRNSLDAKDDIEVLAAVEACGSFAQKSADFAMNIYPKILLMMNDTTLHADTSVALLSVLRHTHFSSDVAFEVRQQCVAYLGKNLSRTIVCNTLTTLTLIAINSQAQIPEHIDLLLGYFLNDTRSSVKRTAISELTSLARDVPHHWTKPNVQNLLNCMEVSLPIWRNSLTKILSELVKCPCLLSEDPSFTQVFNRQVAEYSLRLLKEAENIKLTANCFEILVSLCSNGNASQEISSHVVGQLKQYIESKEIEQEDKDIHSSIYKSIVKLTDSDKTSHKIIVHLVDSLLNDNSSDLKIKFTCEALLAVSSDLLPHRVIDEMPKLLRSASTRRTSSIGTIFTLYLHVTRVHNESFPLSTIDSLHDVDHWTCFKIARQSMRYGHHEFAFRVLDKLRDTLSSESSYFWITCLRNISQAEQLLSSSKSDNQLNRVISLYIEACSMLRASVTATIPMTFQCEYLTLRYKLLQAHLQLRQSCRLLRTAPAPAIAAAVAQSTRDDLLKCGTIVVRMRKCAKDFRSLSDAYSSLFQSSFNADNQTLTHVQLLQNSCTIVAEAIECLFLTNRVSALFVNKNTQLDMNIFNASSKHVVENKQLIVACHRVSSKIQDDLSERKSTSIDDKQIAILNEIGEEVMSVALCLPRLFFQCVQSTCIKLAVSPQTSNSGELCMITTNSDFTLKVEGVVVTGNHKKQVRTVARVMLNVTSAMVTKAAISDFGNMKTDTGINVNTVVVPHNDYFQTQLLLSFSEVGVHTINVESSIIDENGAQWKTGPSLTIQVHAVEDSFRS